MAKKKTRQDRSQTESAEKFNNPFAGLSALRNELTGSTETNPPEKEVVHSEPEPAPSSESAVRAEAASLGHVSKLVVSKEKKGRGGKVVTRVAGWPEGYPQIDDVARSLAKALGCGVSVEDEAVLVQGGQSERVAEWLQKEGVKRVIVGSK